MSESNYLHPYLLKDQIEDIKNNVFPKQVEELEGIPLFLAISNRSIEDFWEDFKAKCWSDDLDERDYENAKLEYEHLVDVNSC